MPNLSEYAVDYLMTKILPRSFAFFLLLARCCAYVADKGWVDYKWPNPVSIALEAKSSYVEKAGDVIIGCGTYK